MNLIIVTHNFLYVVLTMFNSLKQAILRAPAGEFFYKLFFFLTPIFVFAILLKDVLILIAIVVILGYIIIVLEEAVKEFVVAPLKLPPRSAMPVLLVFLATITIFIAFVLVPIVLAQSSKLAIELPGYYVRAQTYLDNLFGVHFGPDGQSLVALLGSNVMQYFTTLSKAVLSFSFSSIVNVSSMLVYIIIVPILSYFFVKDRCQIKDYIKKFISLDFSNSVNRYWADVNSILVSYIRGKLLEVLVVGVIAFVLFLAVGLKYSALLATLVGISVLIPFVGACFVTLPVALVAFSQWGFDTLFITTMILYILLQLFDGYVYVPIAFSEQMKLHAGAILLSVMVFGALFGLVGVFFAIPLLAVGKFLLEKKLMRICSEN